MDALVYKERKVVPVPFKELLATVPDPSFPGRFPIVSATHYSNRFANTADFLASFGVESPDDLLRHQPYRKMQTQLEDKLRTSNGQMDNAQYGNPNYFQFLDLTAESEFPAQVFGYLVLGDTSALKGGSHFDLPREALAPELHAVGSMNVNAAGSHIYTFDRLGQMYTFDGLSNKSI